MAQEIKKISFAIEKKGRKYFSGKLNGKYNAQLIINEASADFSAGQTVDVEVFDISKRSKYGTKLVYSPVTDKNRAAVEAANRLEKASRWMSYAERDAKYDRYMQSNAIKTAMELADGIEELAYRLETLKNRIEENRRYWEQVKAEREVKREEELKEREEAREQEVRKMRFVEGVREASGMVGKVVKQYDGSYVFVTGLGKSFRYDSEANGCNYPAYDGELVCYCYYREATAEEIEAYLDAHDRAPKPDTDSDTPVDMPAEKLHDSRKDDLEHKGLFCRNHRGEWVAAEIVSEYTAESDLFFEREYDIKVQRVKYYYRRCAPSEAAVLDSRVAEYEALKQSVSEADRADEIRKALRRDHIVFD